MSDTVTKRLSWGFVSLIGITAAALFYGGLPADASDEHDVIQELRRGGDIIPLSDLLAREELVGMRVLEAELEREDGMMVYELELLDESGRVHERYYDAANGEPLSQKSRY